MSSRTLNAPRVALAALISSLAVLALSPAGASAGPLVASAPDCSEQSMSQVFSPWLDPADYMLAPNGGFEQGSDAWDLSGNASAVAGNESYHVGSADDSGSLRLPAGSSATSSTVCVGLEHPTVRMFAKRDSGLLATGTVEVRFEAADGTVLSAPVGEITGTGSWQPTAPMPIVANLLPLLPGEYTPVQFEITAASGAIRVDDFYVDPRHSS